VYLLGRSVCSQARLLIAFLASQTADEKRLFRIRCSGHLKDQVVMLEYLRAAKEDQNSAVFFYHG
jgi:benzoyl-CoA reductase/2-hydroxyglutaryl-CoA dehydratase subunit BcrC/BadD/HgdB